jgi:hypothetical protein
VARANTSGSKWATIEANISILSAADLGNKKIKTRIAKILAAYGFTLAPDIDRQSWPPSHSSPPASAA